MYLTKGLALLIGAVGILDFIFIAYIVFKDSVSSSECKDVNSKILYKIYRLSLVAATSLVLIMVLSLANFIA